MRNSGLILLCFIVVFVMGCSAVKKVEKFARDNPLLTQLAVEKVLEKNGYAAGKVVTISKRILGDLPESKSIDDLVIVARAEVDRLMLPDIDKQSAYNLIEKYQAELNEELNKNGVTDILERYDRAIGLLTWLAQLE